MKRIAWMLLAFFAIEGYATTREEVLKWAKSYEYSRPRLLEAIIQRESGFNPLLFNKEKSGSYGLMQIQCDTAKARGLKYSCDQLFNPKINVRFGVLYLQWVEDRLADPTIENIVAAYNAGFDLKGWKKAVNGCLEVSMWAAKKPSPTQEMYKRCQEIKWHPRRCKNYNVFRYDGFPPMECFPGEYINQEYVWKVTRLYYYLKNKNANLTD